MVNNVNLSWATLLLFIYFIYFYHFTRVDDEYYTLIAKQGVESHIFCVSFLLKAGVSGQNMAIICCLH